MQRKGIDNRKRETWYYVTENGSHREMREKRVNGLEGHIMQERKEKGHGEKVVKGYVRCYTIFPFFALTE